METLALSAISVGILAFLIGAVWLTVAVHRTRRLKIPLVLAALGLVAANAGGGLYLFGFVDASCGCVDPVITITQPLALLGLIGLVVGIVWTAVYRLRRRSLQAPAVLAGLAIVASLRPASSP